VKKQLTRIDVLGLVIGSVIGWGAFTLPGKQFLPTSGVVNTTLGLVIGGILVVVIQNAYHTMLEHNKEEGGEFTYAYDNLGKAHGFVVAWSLSLCYLSMIPLNASAYVLLFKVIFQDKINFIYMYSIAGYEVYLSDVIFMSIVILIFAYINVKGLRVSSKVQDLMSGLLVAIVLVILILMITKGDMVSFSRNYISDYRFSFGQIATVIAIVPFLFVGFDVIPQVSNELRFPVGKATKLAIASIVIGIFIYAALNIIAGIGFGPSEAAKSDWAVADSIVNTVGHIGFVLMLVALWAAITGGINGFMIASSKLISALGAYEIISKKFHTQNGKGAYPYAIIFVSGISLIAPWIGREVILYIVDMASLLAAIAYGYVGYISIGKSKDRKNKLLAKLAVVISVGFILLLTLPYSPAQLSGNSFIFLAIWVVLGWIMYMSKNRTNKDRRNE